MIETIEPQASRAPQATVKQPPWQLRVALPPSACIPITLDEHQRRVVEAIAQPGHGPLLLLAGPGTGKTTTLVEAVAARVASGTDPSRILTLTFSRKAANELRSRIGARLNRTVAEPLAWTFHGFGYSLVSRAQPEHDAQRILRLLSGPEQDVAVREMVSHDLDVGSVAWPANLRAALPTRGFSDELRALLGRARSLGCDPSDLRRFAAGRPDWLAAADFMAEYLDVLDARGVLDYSELIVRAVAYAESPRGRRELSATYDLVIVDEYQDTDPAQERLLQALAGSGRDLAVVGDPDQSIYGFRGAEVQGIVSFPERFPQIDGSPATVLTLRTSRRCPSTVLAASRRIAETLGGTGTPLARQLRLHRDLGAAPQQPEGSVEVLTFATPEDEASAVADLLRREHFQNGTAWSDMAVLVRSGVLGIPPLQRALAHVDVPVEVAGDEVPLAREPALAPLLMALRAVTNPHQLTDDVVRELLLSPLIDSDPATIRRLGRELRERARLSGAYHQGPPSSSSLIGAAIGDPSLLTGLADAVASPCRRLATLLADARRRAESGAGAHEVLWSLWSGTSWPDRMQQASNTAGSVGRVANRDLDAIVALFDMASRTDERITAQGVASFVAEVEAQQIPGDTLAECSTSPAGVRLLTAHRSKGLEWGVVVVCGVQDEQWPDLRRRGSLLQAERLGAEGAQEPASIAERRRDEARLFYVAITRARRRLVVTAVSSPLDDGPRPSPFLAGLGVAAQPSEGRQLRRLTFAGLTARLRAVVVDGEQPASMRRAAAERLAVLASLTVNGREVAPAAHPDRWWGTSEPSHADTPVRSPARAIDLSGSQLERIVACPLQWFLSREVAADPPRGSAAGFGGIVHALADGVARGQVSDEMDELLSHADSVWQELQYGAEWQSMAERTEAAAALARFVSWHRATRGRQIIATEQTFETQIMVSGRAVRLRGRLDRLELDDDGRVVVVDLKTSRSAPPQRKVDGHLQLATYQRVIAESAIPGATGEPGGAELVQLRVPAGRRSMAPKVQHQARFPAGAEMLEQALERAVDAIEGENFRATPGESCSYCPFTAVCPAKDSGRQVIT